MINTLFLTLFLQHLQTYIHGLSCHSFKLKNSELKTTHNNYRDCRVHIPTTFLEIAVSSKVSLSPRGDYSQEFLVGVCRPVLQILTLFQTRKCLFHTRFQTRPLKSIPVFRPALQAEIMLSLLSQSANKKIFKSISNSHISLSFLLIWNWNEKIRSYGPVVPSKTIHDSGPKWAESIPHFTPKRRKNPPRWGGT